MDTDGDGIFNQIHRSLVDLLKNDIVRDEIVSFLNIHDLKALSEVSKDTLSAVRNSKGFRKKTNLLIGFGAVRNHLASIENLASSWPWRNVKIDVRIPIDVLRSQSMKQLLEGVESVALHFPFSYRACSTIGNCFEGVLERAKNLKHLELDPSILVRCCEVLGVDFGLGDVEEDMLPFLSSDEVFSNMETLETLQITGGSGLHWSQSNSPMDCMKLMKLVVISDELKKLSSLYNCGDARYPSHPPHFASDYAHMLAAFIMTNKDTLEELEIGPIDSLRFRVIGNMSIPKLKRLSIIALKEQVDHLEFFLSNKPELASLHISMKNRFAPEIFQVIEEKQSKLTDLCISMSLLDPGVEMDWVRMNGDFLKKLTGLKCLVLRQLNSNSVGPNHAVYGYGEDILKCIPPSVKILALEGFEFFWRESTQRTERNIWRRLSHLKNLEELSFHRSNDTFNDEGLQDLIFNCPDLTALAFSHCSQLTKYGVAGVDANGARTGVSLDQLSGLKYLSIRSCPMIHKEDLLPVVKFRFLTAFYFDGLLRDESSEKWTEWQFLEIKKTNKDLISRLLSENPCLEKLGLRIPLSGLSDRAELLSSRKHRRLTIPNVNLELPELRLVNNFFNPSDNDSDVPLKR